MRLPAALLLVPLLAAVAAGCQLCGLEPARCAQPYDRYGACGPDDYCSPDGFCRPVPRAPVVGVCEEVAAELEVRHLGLSVQNGGAAAIDEALGAALPVLSCGTDASACGLSASGTPGELAYLPVPLRGADDPGTTPVLDSVAFLSDGPPLDIAEGFALEVVFRTPSALGAGPIVTMSDGVDGWLLATDPEGYLGFAVGERVLFVSVPTLQTWHHVLCLVNTPSLLAGGDDDDLLCVIDGALAQAQVERAGASPLFDGPLAIGAYQDGAPHSDVAVAALRLWAGDPFAGIDSSSERQDALVDSANRRLAQFHGLALDVPTANLRIARLGFDLYGENVKLQPITRSGITRFELVPARWPRTALAADLPGLLVEGLAVDLADPDAHPLTCYGAAPSGQPVAGPGGVRGACALSTAVNVNGTIVPSDAFVPEQDDLTFSVFVDRLATADIGIADTRCRFDDGVLDDSGRGSGECRLEANFADGFFRLIAQADRPPARAPYLASFTGTVWSPQIEVGPDATTPFNVPIVRDGEVQLPELRLFDFVSLERLGLTRGDATSMTARVVPLGDLDLGDITLGESVDFLRSLVLSLEEVRPGVVRGGGALTEDFATIEMRDEPRTWDGSTPLAFGVDLGTPVVRCGERCNAGVGAGTMGSPGQWEVLEVFGSGGPFVLANVDVSTRGSPPLEIAFQLHPEVAPTGCMLGRYPDIALVGCAHGACTEGTTSRVVWQGEIAETVPGPGLDELALAGQLSAEPLEVTADALSFEVRFLPGGEGTVLALEDEQGPFLEVAVRDGVLTLERRGADPVPFGILDPASNNDDDLIPYAVVDGTWVQASCWIGAESVCVTNLSTMLGSEGEPLEVTIRRARIGEGAAALAFARVWSQPADMPGVDIIRLTAERVASSFGLGMAARRSPTLLTERRRTEATVERDGTMVTVGPSWPRVELVDGLPAYLSDAAAGEALRALGFDLVGENRGILELALAAAPSGEAEFQVLMDASEPTRAREDSLTLRLIDGPTTLERSIDADTGDFRPADHDTITFDGVQSATIDLSWRNGVMTAETDDGALAVRQGLEFPFLGYVNHVTLGSARAAGASGTAPAALRHLRLSSR